MESKWGAERNETEKKLDNKDAWRNLGRALVAEAQLAEGPEAQKKFKQAVDAFEKVIVYTKDQSFLYDASETYRLWEAKLALDPTSKLGDRLGLIQNGLAALPANPKLLGRLYEISNKKGPEAEEAQTQIRDMLSYGVQEPILYFIMASHAYNEGRKDDAKRY